MVSKNWTKNGIIGWRNLKISNNYLRIDNSDKTPKEVAVFIKETFKL